MGTNRKAVTRTASRATTTLLVVAAAVVIAAVATRQPGSETGNAAGRSRGRATPSSPSPSTTSARTSTAAARPRPLRLTTLVLTVDGLDHYDVSSKGDDLRFVAPKTNAGRNLRDIAWDPDVAPSRDQEACATWTFETDHEVQQGLTLRTRHDGNRWRTITVTKNVVMDVYSNINVHTWDSARATAIQNVGAAHIVSLVRKDMDVLPLPWRVCARAIGDHVDIKAWPTARPEPSWTDPRSTGTIPLPAGWDIEGHPGWYAGHLPPGGAAAATAISAGSLDAGS